MNERSSSNTAFALYRGIMQHYDTVEAVSFAEHLEAQQGYQLLIAAVK